MRRSSNYPLIVAVVSALTHLIFFGYPAQVIFDETHFGFFITAYLNHTYFFDIHPPFAKLLIAAAGAMGGYHPSFSFAAIGMAYPDAGYLLLRLIPTIAGMLLPLVFYYLLIELGCYKKIALFMGVALALENSLIVGSRFILTDSILLLTGFLAFYFFLRYRNDDRVRDLFLCGVFGALALSTKWLGLAYLGIAALFFFMTWIGDRPWKFKSLGIAALALIVVPTVIYVSLFGIHFAMLYRSGNGDGFASAGFQKTLVGNAYANDPNVAPFNFSQKFIELNEQMFIQNHQTYGNPYASKWYEWPLMIKPILYWRDATRPTNENETVLYFIGNPVLWVLGFLSLLAIAGAAVWLWIKKGFRRFLNANETLVVVGYCASFFPLAFIGRILFLYHYSAAYIFSLIALALCLQWALPRLRAVQQKWLWIGLITITFIGFAVIAPVTYGIPVSRDYLRFMSPLLHDQW